MTGNPVIPEEGCPRRGRPHVLRDILVIPESRCYLPRCFPDENRAVISLNSDEIEPIRPIDIEGLEQEEAAKQLGVSRKTAWCDLQEVSRKIADTLVNG